MTKKTLFFTALFVSGVFLVNMPGACLAQSANDTKINKRDRSPKELTAGQQGETEADLNITKEIRKAIINDKSLSSYAHNVKIITINGMVTLKGPVRSEDEKRTIENIAAQIAGSGKFNSEIDIAPSK